MGAQKALEEQRVFASAMVEGRDVRNWGVVKVLKAELLTVRLMAAGGGASISAALKVQKVGRNIA